MRNTHGFKNLATALIITLLGGLTLPAMNAAAGPIMGGGPQHSLSDHEIDFWINDGDLIEVDVPRMTEVGDVFIDGGNLPIHSVMDRASSAISSIDITGNTLKVTSG